VNRSAFIGVDLAWRGGNRRSGVAVLNGNRRKAEVKDIAILGGFEEIIKYIDCHSEETAFVAIDAPLIIKNRHGQRRCETLIGNSYGDRHASCHTSNLSLYPNADSVRLASDLFSRGFVHAPSAGPSDQRVMLEVYPHPALLELYSLPTILKYKKGRADERRTGQQELQKKICELSHFAPPLEFTSKLAEFLAIDTNSLRGNQLKANEDKLDAIVCAYIAYHFWFWGTSRTLQFADVNSGYITVPITAPKISASASFSNQP
jgi:predicted RNase H-like nuclease